MYNYSYTIEYSSTDTMWATASTTTPAISPTLDTTAAHDQALVTVAAVVVVMIIGIVILATVIGVVVIVIVFKRRAKKPGTAVSYTNDGNWI